MSLDPAYLYERYKAMNDDVLRRGQYSVTPDKEFDYLRKMEQANNVSERLKRRALQQSTKNAQIRLGNRFRPPPRILFPRVPNVSRGTRTNFLGPVQGGGGGGIRKPGSRYPHRYGKVRYSGETVDRRTKRMLRRANRIYKGPKINLSQGSYSRSVAASEGTHAGGGVGDIIQNANPRMLRALKRAGFTAWMRLPGQGPWPKHIHFVDPFNKKLSPQAFNQVDDVYRKRMRRYRRSVKNQRTNGPLGNGPGPRYEGSGTRMRNAAEIARVGRRLGVNRKGILTAITAALVESNLKDLPFGHSSSVGIFQQQDPWGSFRRRTNTKSSAKMFFTGGRGGQPGYKDIPRRQRRTRGIGQLAQEVQESGFPGRYRERKAEARRILRKISKRRRR